MFHLCMLFFIAILFFILTPGILVTIPKKSSKKVVALVHALVFAIVLYFTHKIVFHGTEGFADSTDIDKAYASAKADIAADLAKGVPADKSNHDAKSAILEQVYANIKSIDGASNMSEADYAKAAELIATMPSVMSSVTMPAGMSSVTMPAGMSSATMPAGMSTNMPFDINSADYTTMKKVLDYINDPNIKSIATIELIKSVPPTGGMPPYSSIEKVLDYIKDPNLKTQAALEIGGIMPDYAPMLKNAAMKP